MTRDEILAMKPGRELNALVAEKVMGWKIRRTTVLAYGSNPLATFRTLYTVTDVRGIDWSPTYDLDGVDLPRYSTDISAAMLSIQAAMEKAQAHVDIELFYNSALDGRVTVHDMEGREDIIIPYGASLLVKTLPEAICKAALLAVMGE